MDERAQHPHDNFRKDLWRYVSGLLLALGLTGVAFSVVFWSWLPPGWALGAILLLGLLQLIVHFRFFLHISLARSARDDLNLLLFSGLIILLMVGGTLLIIFNLQQRMG